MITAWKEPAYEYLLKQDYLAVAHYYEEALETEPKNYNYYWYLGLAYLLLEQEDEGQATWLVAMSAGSQEEIEIWTTHLVEILSTEAQRQESLGDDRKSLLIRRHLQEIAPTLLTNLLALIPLTINLGYFHPELLKKWEVIEIVKDANSALIDSQSLLKVIELILNFPSYESLALTEVSLPHLIQLTECCLYNIFTVLIKVAYQQNKTSFAADIAELCLNFYPNNLYILKHLCGFYLYGVEHQKAIKIAQDFFQNSNCLSQKLFANFRLIQALIGASAWKEVKEIAQRHKDLLIQVIQEKPKQLDSGIGSSFICITGLLSYLEDNPQESRYFYNQIAQLFQQDFCAKTPALVSKANFKQINKTLKIGYIAHTLKKHSVGWLSRWLLQHHNRDTFQIALYMINQAEDELTQKWFRQNADIIHNLQPDAYTIAKQIQTDEIDILVDLDSITLDITCQVMALRPAPIQVTWLGMDASGLPTIDYFIADPYVLPENAQNYYVEKIWRLPCTYVALDGFEVSVPTLRREDLGIPVDAVVYLSAQSGFKRHPDTIRLQMQILKEVSSSYFLIKGVADEQVIQQLFIQIAEEEGVKSDRLKFLSRDINECTHRANLQIADIVLDTYPYNGATTTLETLWMEIPLVTRVGEQFAARNSYTFLHNVGAEEGIAWTDEEYVKWGIKLGKEKALRKKINSKLKAAKQTSPLWNARQFTRDMEQAYQKMWINYCS
ncbi:O-linked N-acetylglucosamine transferase, SPINDLY family protein [Pleurocapsa sp. CCALA 161]|uniref:O-linked N-acetylglucosamine transferase, SPINDLY family protein n=1 Tax=Pleurocapsa sp. CCALA 161 TaxID=2107688 RepID=UPI000D057210|nr:O-linked N-acetylglucosamine transferase, SPINDLY family protein [Pleurocapsa sp. CCALA 161]PSB08615.1 O-linked N-acetylglucosamine transferase, SPINDLY family protein [Pleurocapsa sp. CCALA 161]